MAVGDSAGLFGALPDAAVAYDPGTGEIVAANDACRELLDAGETELRGADVSSLVIPDGDSTALTDPERLARARSEGRAGFACRVETGDGQVLPVEATLTVTTRDDRELAVASLRERGDTERGAELERLRDRYRTLYRNGEVFLWEFDLSEAKRRAESLAERTDDLVAHLDDNPADHERILDAIRVLDVNERAVQFYEADSKAELVDNLDRVMTEQSVEKLKRLWATVADDGTDCRIQCTARTLEGNRRHLVFELAVPEGHADDYDRVYVTGLDVTERIERERALAAARDARRALQESLADATSRTAFAEAVCAELTAIDPIALVRIGTPTPAGTIDVLVEAGEPIHDADPASSGTATAPGVSAVREGETRCIRVGDGGPEEAPTPDDADVIAVPTVHDRVTRGVLVVHLAERTLLSGERIRTLIEEAADVIGYALGSAARRRALAADDEIELTVAVDGDGLPLVEAFRTANADGDVTAAIPHDGESVLCYLAVERGDPAEVIDAARGTRGIESVDRIGAPGEARIQAVTSGPVPNAVIAEAGGRVVDAGIEAGRVTVTARFPCDTPFEPLLDGLAERFGEVTTVGYTTEPTDLEASASPLAGLTDRQREVLEAAFRAGYFERPRDQDARTVADRLGVSRQAYQQVLRAAQRNLLSEVFAGAG